MSLSTWMLVKMLVSAHQCHHCREIFSLRDLNEHTKNLPAFASIFCKMCKKLCRSEESQYHHNFLYYCRICHSYLKAESYLGHKCFHKKATQNKASRIKVICDKCKAVYFSKKDLIDHIQKCQMPKQVICCGCCKEEFFSNEDLRIHISSLKNLENDYTELTCYQCELSFESNKTLKFHIKSKHVNNHKQISKNINKSKSKKYECRFCQKQFIYKNEMKSHEKEMHPNDMVTCSICQKELPFRRLGPHSRWHRTREKYKTKPRKVCDICGFASKFIGRHMKVHKDERRYKCNICGKSFKLSSCLSNHKLVHSDIARHKCHVCDKAFKSNFNLQVHLRSHEVIKPFPCVVCGKTFTTKQSRDNHLKTHDK